MYASKDSIKFILTSYFLIKYCYLHTANNFFRLNCIFFLFNRFKIFKNDNFLNFHIDLFLEQ